MTVPAVAPPVPTVAPAGCTLPVVRRTPEWRRDPVTGERDTTPRPRLVVVEGGVTVRAGRARAAHPAGKGPDDDGPVAG